MTDGKGKVLGIGGVFFRAHDPDALTAWYRDMLGIGAGCTSGEGEPSEWYWQGAGRQDRVRPVQA